MEYSYNIYDPEWVERKKEVQLYDIFSVGCTDGYYCNAPSVLYYGNIICLKSRRDDIIVESCNAKPHTSTSRRNDINVGYNISGSKLIENGVYLYKIMQNNREAVRNKLIIVKQ